MTTAAEIITDALAEIGYLEAETPVEADDMRIGLRKLNDMLAEYMESGILPGANTLATSSDTVRISRGMVNGVMMNLAGRLATPFQRPITPGLSASIKAANKNFLRITSGPIDVDYPSTLPMGSGNRCDDDDDIFFPPNQKPNF